MTDKDKKSTKWKPGTSGNPDGRPVGSGKAMTDAQLAETLGKRTKGAIDTIVEIMNTDKNPNARLKAAISLLGYDEKMRQFMYKKIQDSAEHREASRPSEDKGGAKAPVLTIAKRKES
jgi:hypothetical protein